MYTIIVPSIHRLELVSYVQKVFDKYSCRIDSTSLGNDLTPFVEHYNRPHKLIFRNTHKSPQKKLFKRVSLFYFIIIIIVFLRTPFNWITPNTCLSKKVQSSSFIIVGFSPKRGKCNLIWTQFFWLGIKTDWLMTRLGNTVDLWLNLFFILIHFYFYFFINKNMIKLLAAQWTRYYTYHAIIYTTI